jgi:YbbR domain-containing protein
MKRLLLHNLGWKLVSLCVAVLAWFLIAREPDVATTLNVPIEFKSMPDDLDISSEMPDRIRVEVRGPASRLTRDNVIEAAVVLDLTTVTRPGERTFTFQERNVKLPKGVRFYKAVPSQITVRFEHLVYKTVQIRARYAAAPPDGWAVISSSFDPPAVRIVGPESHVQPIEFVTTDPIDLSNTTGKAEMRVQLNLGDPQVRMNPSPTAVKFRVVLEKRELK